MKKLILSLTVLSLFAVSCKKDLGQVNEESSPVFDGKLVSAEKMTDIKVPAGFKWETSKDIKLKLTTTDIRFDKVLHKIEVYTANPAEGGVLLSEGSIGINTAFEVSVNIPTFVSSLYLVKIAPDKSKYEEKININGTSVMMNISVQIDNKKSLGKSSGPDCTTGCTTTENDPSGNKSYSSGVTCLTGTININNLTLQNSAVVRICGTGTISNFNFNGNSNSTLIITSTGVISSPSTIPVQTNVIVYGELKTTGNNKHININSNSTFTNFGNVETTGDFNPNGQSVIVNNGTITVGSKLINNSGSDFTNNCKLFVIDDFQNNGLFKNYGYVKCNEETTIQGGSNNEFKQFNGAMLSTKNIQVNGNIQGIGATNSLIKVTGNSKGNAQGVVSGTQIYCDVNGIEGPWNASINGGATQGCALYIPVSSCNPEGNGIPPITDTDNDGVADNNDDYPNDATKAYNNSYGTSTVAFEDLWPSRGDYDLNDVVVSYNYNVVTNAANNVVRVEAVYALRATGGAFNNGFGVQFPVNRNQVSSVNGATLESDQTKAVLIVFNDMRSEMNQWNTMLGQTSPVVTYNVSFNVTGTVSLASFGLGSYNPFIWNGSAGFGRGYEVHLPGKLPTDKATASIFGTVSDNTNVNAGTTYVSKDGGYPWAINIPAAFDYPVEKADVNTAYTKFATWVSSGGAQFSDWYLNNPGYRNSENIYQ